ncbi:MAG TPA: ABC transporter permease [Verrucomicrobiae bacterium]|jgi:putative ABC transport system permease protein|nr:ABC transporter permease [Verrucomicrobiae bacterium]
MSSQNQSWTDRMYRMLLRILPFDFRVNFGGAMQRTFHEQASDVERKQGKVGLLKLWAETIAGMLQTAPGEHWQMLRHDTRYALRMMRKNKGFTAIAVITLALGIGANSAIFSVINGILLRPLPYLNGEQLVVMRQQAPGAGAGTMGFSVLEVNDYRQQNHTLSGMVEYHSMGFTLLSKTEAERVRTGVVSANFFDFFGVKPILGRTLLPADEEPGAPPVLVLTYEFWQRSQHGDPNIVGKTFEMNDKVHTVVGVLPPFPQYPNNNDVYMPTSACPARSSPKTIANRGARMVRVFGRLNSGVTQTQAQTDLATIAGRLQHEYAKFYPADTGFTATATPLREELVQQARPTLFVLLAAAGFVLLIACANVANFTLARVSQREQELLLRSALGAGRGRLLRQLVTESTILGLMAAALGLLLASLSVKLLVEFASRLTPRANEITIDGRVLLFTLLAALLTSIVSGSVLGFSSRQQLATGLREGARQSNLGKNRKRTRNTLIVAQVAFSFVLLIGAGLMLKSLVRLQSVDPGFVPQRVLTMDLDLNWSKYRDNSQYREFAHKLLEKVQVLPGVQHVAVASNFPLDPDLIAYGSGHSISTFQIEGQPLRAGETPPLTAVRLGTVDYFRTLGIPLIKGRAFAPTDNEKAAPVVVVNQALARHRWAGVDPIGKRITFDEGKTWDTVVGIVGDTKEFSLNQEGHDEAYGVMDQYPNVGSLLVRTTADPMLLANEVRRAVFDVDPQTAIANLQTLEQARGETLSAPRVMANLLALFAALALLIAATGIGGILALSVSQRIHEIGVRLALGAQPGDVLTMVIRQGMVLVIAGLACGLIGAFYMTRPLETFLFEVTPTDPMTFVLVGAVLAMTALAACYIPARRATKIDPLIALRHE